MCVDEVEGDVVVNLLQGEIRIEDGWRDFGLPNRNIYRISMGMWRYSVIIITEQ